MLKLFKDFEKSIKKSEEVLVKTEELVSETEDRMQDAIDVAYKREKTLIEATERADKLADELEVIIMSGNKLVSKLTDLSLEEENMRYQVDENQLEIPTLSGAPDFTEIPLFQDKAKLSQIDYYEILKDKTRAGK